MSGPAVINARDYGATGGGSVDDSGALAEAIAAAAPARVVQLPPGIYRLAQPLVINRPVVLQGSGGAGDTPATILKADDGVTAIVVSREAPGGDWCSVRDLAVRGGASGGHGIHLKARAAIEGCNVSGFGGHGILVDSSAQGDNANNWMVTYTRITSCGGSGLRTVGGDSNSGVALGVDVAACDGWGFDDDSFLGCTFVACHAAANGLGAYRSGQQAANTVLVGCYSESDQPLSQVTPKTVVVGGTHGAPLVGVGGAPVTLHGGANSPLEFLSALTGLKVRVGTGEGDTSGGILSFTEATGGRAYLKHMGSTPPAYGIGTRIYGWNAENTGDAWAFSITGKDGVHAVMPEGVGRTPGAGWLNFPRGYFQRGHFVGMDTQPPTAGAWLRGDRIENAAPSPGGVMGWVCVQAGDFASSPPVFRSYGGIEP